MTLRMKWSKHVMILTLLSFAYVLVSWPIWTCFLIEYPLHLFVLFCRLQECFIVFEISYFSVRNYLISSFVHCWVAQAVWNAIHLHETVFFCCFFSNYKAALLIELACYARVTSSESVAPLLFSEVVHNAKWRILFAFRNCGCNLSCGLRRKDL